ncbi:MAG: hypothetical protein J7J52_04795 [Deltaproteobacteria bacterium]|nr:hypothetical protein [Deltaproteobacteria bacterium]
MPFKVVEKRTRWGFTWSYFKNTYSNNPEIYRRGLKFRKKHPEFFPHYYKRHIVKGSFR